jgi:hypothetical protein
MFVEFVQHITLIFPLVRRKGVVRIICENPRHKQRQG